MGLADDAQKILDERRSAIATAEQARDAERAAKLSPVLAVLDPIFQELAPEFAAAARPNRSGLWYFQIVFNDGGGRPNGSSRGVLEIKRDGAYAFKVQFMSSQDVDEESVRRQIAQALAGLL